MKGKIKLALLAVAFMIGNEIVTLAVLLFLAAPAAYYLMKEVAEHD